MTIAKLSHRHGFSDDCNDRSGWSADGVNDDGNTSTLEVDDDDFFNINVSASAGNKVCYYEEDFTNVSSDAYGRLIAKYKTSDSSIKAKIVLVFTAGDQTVLAETSSTTWKSVTVDVTASKTIDKIRIYANQATGDVFYDFFLICKAQFTLPHVGPGGVQVRFPMNVAKIPIPGRYGDVLQNLGMHAVEITVTGDVHPNEDVGEWESGSGTTRTGPHFEYLLDALHKDVWNWFTCDYPDISCKVMVEDFAPELVVEGSTRVMKYVLKLLMYSRSSLDLATWGDVEWIGYES